MKKIMNLAVFALILLVSVSGFAQEVNKKVTLEDVWKNYTFYARSVRGVTSMNDGVHYTTLERLKGGQCIIKYSYKTGKVVDTLVKVNEIKGVDLKMIEAYEFSADESMMLLMTNSEPIYRHSFTADYYIYDLKSGVAKMLSENGKQQLATFSPDGSKIAFVRKNNMFYTNLASGEEVQFTKDGEFNKIINGAPDWVYEEEFGFSQAFAWAPDSKKIAFIKFDESQVKEFGMTMFEGQAPQMKDNALYPENRVWKYPKAGEDNSITSVHVYHLDSQSTVGVDVGTETDQYIPRIRWTHSSENLSVFRLNRLQNKFELLFVNPATGSSKVAFTEENKYYIAESAFDNLTFLEDNKHFVWTSERDGWNHIYLVNMEGEIVRQLTKGEFDVTDFIGFDAKKKYIYYQAAKESPLRREVYAVALNGKKDRKLSAQAGTNKAVFSKSYKYFINYFSNAQTPLVVTLHDAKGKQIRELKNNNRILETLSEYDYSLKEFFTFTTAENVELNGYMIKPVGFDASKKYPVMMTQYSGPNSQSCADDWDFGWENYLAQEGFIVVCIDGRGTAARGEEFRKCTYLQLGRYESDDQIEGAKYLGALPYVDKENISIWGWSFGGFMVSLSMTKSDVFKAGIAVAPVTNWRYYDNIYTERFMRTPQENPEGYDQNSPLYFADSLSGNLLIVHGSADDNVHVQNTMEFIERLVQADKQFDMMIYTNRNHSIFGKNTRYHLFNKMTNFLKENLMEE